MFYLYYLQMTIPKSINSINSINCISRVLQNLLKHFNGTAISSTLVTSLLEVLFLDLNLNDSVSAMLSCGQSK